MKGTSSEGAGRGGGGVQEHGRRVVFMKGMVGGDAGEAGWGQALEGLVGHTGTGNRQP